MTLFEYDDEGRIYVITKLGRRRRNWKNNLRKSSRIWLKKSCENCGSKDHLTIHHKQSLEYYFNPFEDNCMTLCMDCHNNLEYLIKSKVNYRINSSLKTRKETYDEIAPRINDMFKHKPE